MATDSFWLMKTEPSTYSFEELKKDKKTNWDGVRNFLARKHLLAAKKGDEVLIYHSGDDKAVQGIAKVIKEAYPDPDPKKKGDWVQLDLAYVKKFKEPVTLKTLKSVKKFEGLTLIKNSRLSVMPVSKSHFAAITKLGL